MKKAVYPKTKLVDWTMSQLERDLKDQGFDLNRQILSRMDPTRDFVIYEQNDTAAYSQNRFP